jgi:hypothetical protein
LNGLGFDPPPEPPKDFNKEVKSALDMVILGLTGPSVLVSLHRHLKDHYGITPDEIPYRLNTVFGVLESVFGVAGVDTIKRATAKRLCQNVGLDFSDVFGYDLPDYVELCKKRLAQTALRNEK